MARDITLRPSHSPCRARERTPLFGLARARAPPAVFFKSKNLFSVVVVRSSSSSSGAASASLRPGNVKTTACAPLNRSLPFHNSLSLRTHITISRRRTALPRHKTHARPLSVSLGARKRRTSIRPPLFFLSPTAPGSAPARARPAAPDPKTMRRQPARPLPLLLLAATAACLLLLSMPRPAAAARSLSQFWGQPWSGPAYADAGRGTFAYSGLVGMPGSPSVIRRPGFFWGRRL